MKSTSRYINIAMLSAAGSVLFIVETLIEAPFPWIRLGLANIVTLIALQWWGLKEAFAVVVLRVFIGSLIIGRLFHPVFFLSISGSLTAAFVMALAMQYNEKLFSLIGISIIGATVKNMTQLSVVYLIYIRQITVFYLIPLFLFISIVSGFLVGIAALLISKSSVISTIYRTQI